MARFLLSTCTYLPILKVAENTGQEVHENTFWRKMSYLPEKRRSKHLPLLCSKKEKNLPECVNFEVDPNYDEHYPIPVPIDEFVDYTIEPHSEGSERHIPQKTLDIPDSGAKHHASSVSESEKTLVEEDIKFSVFVQAESGPSKSKVNAKPLVKRAEGLPVVSPRGSDRGEKSSRNALSQLHDLVLNDMSDSADQVFVTGSLSRAEGAETAAPSARSIPATTDTARSQPGDPSDVLALKRTVRRLTSELSRLLTASRPEGKPVDGGSKLLPGKGPLPPWLCDPCVFAPLMAAYDTQLTSAGKSGGDSSGIDSRLLDMEARVLDVVRENERLRVKLREAATAGPASQTEWDTFAEQARLVLEENQLLLRQLTVQQAKAKMAQREYIEEAAKLKCRIEELEGENAQVRGDFESLHGKLQEVKSKYQSAALERETGEMKTVDCMRSLSKELFDTREEFVRANEELLRQLQKSEREKVKLTQALSDAATERDGLLIEVSKMKVAMHLRHKEMAQLQKSARKRDTLQEHLQSVVGAASDLQEKLDVCQERLGDQEADLSILISYLVNELKFHEKNLTGQSFDEESLNNIPKQTSKLEFAAKRCAALLKGNEDKREEMDKQICYLQSLIRQKSQELQELAAEHRSVQAGIETVWNTAVSS